MLLTLIVVLHIGQEPTVYIMLVLVDMPVILEMLVGTQLHVMQQMVFSVQKREMFIVMLNLIVRFRAAHLLAQQTLIMLIGIVTQPTVSVMWVLEDGD
jgi:hypothetical protein